MKKVEEKVTEAPQFLRRRKRNFMSKLLLHLLRKKSNLQKEAPPAPSESEIDLGVFSAKHGNLLEKIFAASGFQGWGGWWWCR
ncbi:hypothetical protein Hanom_Chr10g00935411 [Helianthus anomalus]